MYVHPAFQAERAASLAFAAARGFGLVVASDGGRPIASPLPFHLDYADDGTPRIAFHVARVNPLAELANKGSAWLISVLGPDSYVSPDWYASPDQVPTWLYQSVQLSGPVRPMMDAALIGHLDDLAETFEGWLTPKPPWTAERITPGRRKQLMKAIVGIEMSVETVTGSFKLNQHKSDADQVAVARALVARPDAAAQALAARMIALRPQLAYEDASPPPLAGEVASEAKREGASMQGYDNCPLPDPPPQAGEGEKAGDSVARI